MKKSLLSSLVLVLMVTIFLSACSKKADTTAEATTAPSAGAATTAAETTAPEATKSAPVSINMFAVQETGIDLKTNLFTKLLEDRFNVKLNFETVPGDGAKEKRQISLASGDYPDTYFLTDYIDQFSQADVVKYGKQGVFLPLNDLIAQYAPNITAAFAAHPDMKAYDTAPDGNIYGLVAYAQCFHCSYANKMWLNTTWLDKLKLKMPTTTAEFKTVLEAFKNNDPNGNGKKDEVPLSGSKEDFGVRLVPFLMNGFIYDDDRNYLNLVNGKVDTAANKPEWKEGLAYIKSLYDEGLIDLGAFTQNAEAFKKIGENGSAQILGAGAGMHPAIFVNIDDGNKYSKDYNAVPPLTGPHSSYATHDGGGVNPGAKFVITNKASKEVQIATIKMIDYLFTPEGQTNASSGKEGLSWRKPNADEVALGKDVAAAFAPIAAVDGQAPRNDSWSGMGHMYMPKEYRDSFVAATDIYKSVGYERRLYNATLLYQGHEPKELFPLWAVWVDPANMDESTMLQTNIKNYIEQGELQFITGNKDLNKDWDAYVKGLDNLKLSRYIEIMQKAYDATAK